MSGEGTSNSRGARADSGASEPSALTREELYLLGRSPSRWVMVAVVVLLAIAFLAVALSFGIIVPTPPGATAADRGRAVLSHAFGTMTWGGEGQAVAGRPGESQQGRIERLLGVAAGRVDDAPAPGSARGMNVIVIQVEALQTLAMDTKVAGQEVTPRLNDLARRSWYAPHTVSQAAHGATSDSEFVANTALYPPMGEPAAIALADRTIPGLPRSLASQGYATVTMHVNDARYWNRVQLYPALGFAGYLDRAYFGSDDTIGWGQSDQLFYSLAADPLGQLSDGPKPYYAQLVSITSHHPFAPIPDVREPLELTDDLEGTTVGRYLRSINFADRALGAFVDTLEARGELDDTVLVVYGDHTALNPNPPDAREAAALAAIAGPRYTRRSSVQVPLIIRMPGQDRGHTLNSLVAQADVAPTVAELLGVQLEAPVFGASAFRLRSNPVVPSACRSPYGSFVTEAGQYVPDADSGSYVFVAADGGTGPASGADAGPIARARELMQLSEARVASLPRRPGAGAIAGDAILPPAGRRALESMRSAGVGQP